MRELLRERERKRERESISRENILRFVLQLSMGKCSSIRARLCRNFYTDRKRNLSLVFLPFSRQFQPCRSLFAIFSHYFNSFVIYFCILFFPFFAQFNWKSNKTFRDEGTSEISTLTEKKSYMINYKQRNVIWNYYNTIKIHFYFVA